MNYKFSPLESYRQDNLEYQKNMYFETVFMDEELFSNAIKFYNSFIGYKDHPINREEAIMYAQLGTRINSEFFRIMRPSNEEELDIFYKVTPFHFFNNILRFMDGMHRTMVLEFEEFNKNPVLDFGGGTGGFSLYLAKKGFQVTFVESNIMCLEWMKYMNIKYKLNIELLDSKQKMDKKFGLIIAKDIMEHVINPEELQVYLHSLIVSGGKIYMSHYPCFGPDEFAPMHFKLGVDKKDNMERFIFSKEANLEYLKNGRYPVINNSVPQPTGQETEGTPKVD